jgi:hypothetical protein
MLRRDIERADTKTLLLRGHSTCAISIRDLTIRQGPQKKHHKASCSGGAHVLVLQFAIVRLCATTSLGLGVVYSYRQSTERRVLDPCCYAAILRESLNRRISTTSGTHAIPAVFEPHFPIRALWGLEHHFCAEQTHAPFLPEVVCLTRGARNGPVS